MKKLVIGIAAASASLVAIVAYATTGHGPYQCAATNANGCSGKVSATFWNDYSKACYSVKADCAGDYVGAKWYVNVSGGLGEDLNVTTEPGVYPSCQASAHDSAGVKGLKASCKTDSVAMCADGTDKGSSAKASVKRRDDLCPCSCTKPDKINGCADSCPP